MAGPQGKLLAAAVLLLIGAATARIVSAPEQPQIAGFREDWRLVLNDTRPSIEQGQYPTMVAASASRVLVVSFPPQVTCVDEATGKQVWRRHIDIHNDVYVQAPEIVVNTEGTHAFVSFSCWGDECGIYALNVSTGDTIWFHKGQRYGQSISAAPNGKDLIVVNDAISAVRGADGHTEWSWEPTDGVLGYRSAIQMEGHGWVMRHVSLDTISVIVVNSNGEVARFNVSSLGCQMAEMPAVHGTSVAFVCSQFDAGNFSQWRSVAAAVTLVSDPSTNTTQFELNFTTTFPWAPNNFQTYGGAAFSNDGKTAFALTLNGVAALDVATGAIQSSASPLFPVGNTFRPVLCPGVDALFFDSNIQSLEAVDVTAPSNITASAFGAFANFVRPPACGVGSSSSSGSKAVFASGAVHGDGHEVLLVKYVQ